MSALAEPSSHATIDDKLARRNAIVLAVAQAFGGASQTIIFSTASIIGAMLAPQKGLATLPITTTVIGMWLGALPVGMLARRIGRRAALQIGSLLGVAAGLISCYAVMSGNFWVLLVGTFCGGLYAASFQSYRFAAADTASEQYRPKAVSRVLAGGVIAAVLGPQLAIFTKDLLSPFTFAATFLAQAGCGLAAMLVLQFIKIPRSSVGRVSNMRPLVEIVRQPRFVVAVACGVAAYATMNLLMTSAPLAMVSCGHSVKDATLGIQWHVLAMYGPSFFTGSLMARFGVARVTALGLTLLILTAVVGVSGLSVAHFWIGLVLLGLGWNFGFIGATAMVAECHRPHERTRVQSFNDFLIFGSLAVSSFSSGQFLAAFGWQTLNEVVVPTVLAAAGLLGWLTLRNKVKEEGV
jgi:predicted MFS family arabinose efflux permease